MMIPGGNHKMNRIQNLSIRVIIALCFTVSVMGQGVMAKLAHEPINEQSSLVKSETYPGVFWVTNDSGDGPYIYPLNEKGEIIIPGYLQKRYSKPGKTYPGIEIIGAVHHDWESMTTLGDTLVIADVGNNGNARRDLGVYLIPEPNPYAVDKSRPLVWLPVHFEDQREYPPQEWSYDCEAVFTFKGKLYFLTKDRSDRHISKPSPTTQLYRMDTRHSDRSNALKKIGAADDLGGWVTGADMAPDGSGLVFIALNYLTTTIWYYPTPTDGDRFLDTKPQYYILKKASQTEGVCFMDSKTLIVSNEQRDWIKVPLSALK
jgi:hypothetical protein